MKLVEKWGALHNCATCALGFQDNSDDKLSFKNLMVASLRREMDGIAIDAGFQSHLRASASKDFQTPKKQESDHAGRTVVDSKTISERDASGDLKLDAVYTFSGDKSLARDLTEHTLFTSGDKEEQKFKTAYARATRDLFEDAAITIQRQFRASEARKLAAAKTHSAGASQ